MLQFFDRGRVSEEVEKFSSQKKIMNSLLTSNEMR